MTRSRRVAIDTGFSQNGSQWSSFGSGVSFQNSSYTQFDLPFTVVSGSNAISTVTLWNNGIVSFGPPTAEQIAFVASGLPPFAGFGVTNPAENPGFPGEFLSFAYDDNEIRFAHDWAQGLVDFQQPFVLADAQPAAFFAFGSDQLILVENGFTILSDSTTSHIGYHIGSQQEILTPVSDPFIFLAIEHDGIESFFTFDGAPIADSIAGTQFNDTINGNDGDDVLTGLFGNDFLAGNAGLDSLFGGDGNDTIHGGDSADILRGGNGLDVIDGDEGNDRISGNDGNDILNGGGNDDRLDGGAGDDVLNGGSGNDLLVGGGSGDIDQLNGGDGDDTYQVQDSADTVFELSNQGSDLIRTGLDYILPANVERLVILASARNATGNALDNIIVGTGGGDTISGLNGADTLRGGAGLDTILGGSGMDRIDGGAGKDTMTGGADKDTFEFRFLTDFNATRATADVITDFDRAAGEKIQINLIDANTNTPGDDDFEWIAGNSFSGTAGELRFQQVGSSTFVEGDVNGDGSADLVIKLNGLVALTSNSFIGVRDLQPNGQAAELPWAFEDFSSVGWAMISDYCLL